MNPALGLAALAVVIVATVAFGVYGLRLSRATSDFYVASREISPLWNASAIGGEYLSAASFLGVAGLVMAYGVDMLAYPVGCWLPPRCGAPAPIRCRTSRRSGSVRPRCGGWPAYLSPSSPGCIWCRNCKARASPSRR